MVCGIQNASKGLERNLFSLHHPPPFSVSHSSFSLSPRWRVSGSSCGCHLGYWRQNVLGWQTELLFAWPRLPLHFIAALMTQALAWLGPQHGARAGGTRDEAQVPGQRRTTTAAAAS